MLQIEIPLPTPSLNQLQRLHFHAKKRLRDQYEVLFRSAATNADLAKRKQSRQVKIERYSSRALDRDNFVGGCKPLLDALTRAGILFDDGPQYVLVQYVQMSCKRNDARTVITIT